MIYSEKGNSIRYLVSDYYQLDNREYKRKHDNATKYVLWLLYGKTNHETEEQWYEEKTGRIMENEHYTIF